jgi:hypothetical protein
MSFEDSTSDEIGGEIGREVDYRDVEADGARRAAERIAELLWPRWTPALLREFRRP